MKIYLSNLNESWIVDRLRREWYQNNKNISTKFIKNSSLIWIISPWTWKKISKSHLKNKKVLCTIHHINEEKLTNNFREEFYERDVYVDAYHVFTQETSNKLETLTDKKIIKVPYWVDSEKWFQIKNKDQLRKKYGFQQEEYLIGSFQRDSEGHDLNLPKLEKGPDIFLDLISKKVNEVNHLKVVLTGKRRNFVINGLKELKIPYYYFEMVSDSRLNELYNVLDLYLVTSRVEGGPQAILECGITKTPILSTNVGVSKDILHKDSIFDIYNFNNAIPNIDYAYNQASKHVIPKGMKPYIELFKKLHEN